MRSHEIVEKCDDFLPLFLESSLKKGKETPKNMKTVKRCFFCFFLHVCKPLNTKQNHLSFILPQCINEEGFRQFLKTYLEVDFPPDLCQRLFRSFQNSEPTQEDGTSKIIFILRIQATHWLHFTASLINLGYGLFGAESFITGCLFSTVCVDMVTRLFAALSFSSHLSCRGGVPQGCFMLLLSAGRWTTQGQARV